MQLALLASWRSWHLGGTPYNRIFQYHTEPLPQSVNGRLLLDERSTLKFHVSTSFRLEPLRYLADVRIVGLLMISEIFVWMKVECNINLAASDLELYRASCSTVSQKALDQRCKHLRDILAHWRRAR